MCWTLLILVLSSVVVGWLAQSWKKRTGALWALITLLAEAAASLLLYAYAWLRGARPILWGLRPVARTRWLLWSVVAALAVGLVMVLVVTTLPTPGQGGSEKR